VAAHRAPARTGKPGFYLCDESVRRLTAFVGFPSDADAARQAAPNTININQLFLKD
jgi:hypothetical protein